MNSETRALIAEARRLENDYGDNYEVMLVMSELADALEESAVSSPSEDERVWSCARCGHAPATHSMPDHPAFQCLYDPVLVAAVSSPPTISAERLAEALCAAMPHEGGGSRLVYEDALEAASAALAAALHPGGETNGN